MAAWLQRETACNWHPQWQNWRLTPSYVPRCSNAAVSASSATRLKHALPVSPPRLTFWSPALVNSRLFKMSLPISAGLGFLFVAYLVIFRPDYLLSAENLGMLIFLQVVAVVLWKFQERFFPFL